MSLPKYQEPCEVANRASLFTCFISPVLVQGHVTHFKSDLLRIEGVILLKRSFYEGTQNYHFLALPRDTVFIFALSICM